MHPRPLQIIVAALQLAVPLAAQPIFVVPATAAENAAAEKVYRETEERLARELAGPRIDLAAAERVAATLNPGWNHPRPEILQALAAAPDPGALALRLAGARHGGAYAVDLLLRATELPAAQSHATALWLTAARLTGEPAQRAAYLDRALSSLRTRPGATAADLEPAASVASWELRELLEIGLASQAVAAFAALPPALRERVASFPPAITTVAGVAPPSGGSDLRLELAVAHLLTGDAETARSLLAYVPPAAARADGAAPDPAAIERALADLWLRPESTDDPFPLLADAAVWLAGLHPVDPPAGLFRLAIARLAARERYPSLASFAWSRLANSIVDFSDPQIGPRPLPDSVRAELQSLRSATLELRRLAAAGAAETVAAGAVPAAASECSAKPDLAMFDRAKHRGLLIEIGQSSAVGCWLDETGGQWRATPAGGWIA
ncbi:MAG TPA: hypothetical protein VGE98_02790 [Thermoanaerobaculia bacterium]